MATTPDDGEARITAAAASNERQLRKMLEARGGPGATALPGPFSQLQGNLEVGRQSAIQSLRNRMAYQRLMERLQEQRMHMLNEEYRRQRRDQNLGMGFGLAGTVLGNYMGSKPPPASQDVDAVLR